MRLLGWIVVLPLALVAIAFAVANRGPVRISFDPLPLAVDLPLYLALFAALFAGIVLGGVAARLAAWRSKSGRAADGPPAAQPPHSTKPAEPTGILLPPPVA